MKDTLDALDKNHSILVEKLNKGEALTIAEMRFLEEYPDLVLKYRVFQSFLRKLPYKGLLKNRTYDIYELLAKLNSK